MLLSTLFDPLALLVLAALLLMGGTATYWYGKGQQAYEQVVGALKVLRRVAGELPAQHPIRKRLEARRLREARTELLKKLQDTGKVTRLYQPSAPPAPPASAPAQGAPSQPSGGP